MSDASEGARAMGRIKTEKKAKAARENIQKAQARRNDPEVRERHRLAQQARRQREREEREREVAARIAEAEQSGQEGQP